MAMFLSIDGMFVGNRGCVYFDKIAIYYDFFQNKPLRNMYDKEKETLIQCILQGQSCQIRSIHTLIIRIKAQFLVGNLCS